MASIKAGTKQPNPIDVHAGGRVRLRRMMLGMSQEKLAESLGLTFQQVQKYEKGTNRMGASRLAHIAGVLGVPVAWLFEDAPGATTPAGASEAAADLSLLLSSGDSIRAARALARVPDAKVRRKLVALVEAMAGVEPAELDAAA